MQGEECLLQAAAGGITLDPWDVCAYTSSTAHSPAGQQALADGVA